MPGREYQTIDLQPVFDELVRQWPLRCRALFPTDVDVQIAVVAAAVSQTVNQRGITVKREADGLVSGSDYFSVDHRFSFGARSTRRDSHSSARG